MVMNFSYGSAGLDAYEWVLLDCMLGDQMLFMREEAVEQTWRLLSLLSKNGVDRKDIVVP